MFRLALLILIIIVAAIYISTTTCQQFMKTNGGGSSSSSSGSGNTITTSRQESEHTIRTTQYMPPPPLQSAPAAPFIQQSSSYFMEPAAVGPVTFGRIIATQPMLPPPLMPMPSPLRFNDAVIVSSAPAVTTFVAAPAFYSSSNPAAFPPSSSSSRFSAPSQSSSMFSSSSAGGGAGDRLNDMFSTKVSCYTCRAPSTVGCGGNSATFTQCPWVFETSGCFQAQIQYQPLDGQQNKNPETSLGCLNDVSFPYMFVKNSVAFSNFQQSSSECRDFSNVQITDNGGRFLLSGQICSCIGDGCNRP